MNTVVAKFGGSSVADAAQIRKVAEILRSDARRSVAVLSAPGKRSKADEKITDMLIGCHAKASAGEDIAPIFEQVRTRYLEIAGELGVASDVGKVLDEVEHTIRNGGSKDYVVSRGEYLGAQLIASYLDAEFVDAAELVAFRDAQTVDTERTYRQVAARLKGGAGLRIVPGFYGAYSDGQIQLFSRGGSDITGALVARGIEAELYENWTDVSGLLMTDPRIVDNPAPISEISYRELRELAYLGAAVFHEEAIFPCSEVGLPIVIRNTNEPEHPGTKIVTSVEADRGDITGIAGREHYRLARVEKVLLNKDRSFLARLDRILERYGVGVFQSASGSDSMAFVTSAAELDPVAEHVAGDIRKELAPDSIDLGTEVALVGIVGGAVSSSVGLGARVFGALGEAGISVPFMVQGYSTYSAVFVVPQAQYKDAIQAIYRTASV